MSLVSAFFVAGSYSVHLELIPGASGRILTETLPVGA
jgi:hypothetical protein